MTRQDSLLAFPGQVWFLHGGAVFILYFCFLRLTERQEEKTFLLLSYSPTSPDETCGVHRAGAGASVE